MDDRSLFRMKVAPFFGYFALLLAAALLGDLILHAFDLVWVGRYLGIPGTLLIVLSLVYSLRKRKVISAGKPKTLLALHEFLTWLGALMVMVHAGIHFNAVLPWLALGAMLVNVLSGMTGRYLLHRSRQHLTERKEKYRVHGMDSETVEVELFWDSITYDLMARWRAVHFPISFAFAALAIGHILTVFMFWGWR